MTEDTITEFELCLKYLEMRGFDGYKRLAFKLANKSLANSIAFMLVVIEVDLKKKGLSLYA